MNHIHIPQFCCATCRHWDQHPGSGDDAVGWCNRNRDRNVGGEQPRKQTLDLALCTKWEKSENADEVMYGMAR